MGDSTGFIIEEYHQIRKVVRLRLFAESFSLMLSFRTLQDINDGLQRNARGKWRSRLMNKNNIEIDLAQFNSQVDDAARSFQVGLMMRLRCSEVNPASLDRYVDTFASCNWLWRKD